MQLHFCCVSDCVILSNVWVLTCRSSGFSKKDGSSNGAGSTGNYKHLAMEGSSLSDLESEDELQIDEAPPPRRKPAGPSKKKKLSGENLTLILLTEILYTASKVYERSV